MTARLSLLASAIAVLFATPTWAQGYAGLAISYSSDADDTEVVKTGLDLDFRHADGDHYQGVSLEVARFRPLGQDSIEHRRLFYRFAGRGAWKWSGRVGSDGHTFIGSAAVHNEAARRQEYFIEREIVETPRGLQDRLYSTYLGAAFDLPFDDRTMLTTVIGVQEFGGENVRLHLRGNVIHSVSPRHGLSAQLRVRYFHDSRPNESDYFAPGWHAQAVPTLQVRRYAHGWRYAVAAGYGVQRTADTSWRPARLVEASVTSPQTGAWTFKAGLTYTNTPASSGLGYDYHQFSLTLGRTF